MSVLSGKVLLVQNTRALVQAVCLVRSPVFKTPVSPGVFVPERQYRAMPTHGIGRFKHLLPKTEMKKKNQKVQMKKIKAASSTKYGVLNVTASGYDMTLVEHYAQYIYKLCKHLDIKVIESYALPTKSTEVMVMSEQGTKMYVDAVLKTHKRVVQISEMKATLAPGLLEVLLINQPEGVQLSVTKHTETEFKGRFKGRPELEGLIAQIR